MAEPIVAPTIDGQEFEIPDVANLAAVAGLADDRVFAELLKLTPYDGTNIYKGIIPYAFKTALAGASPGATVQSSGSANATINVFPFRFAVGSRNAVTGAPPGANPAAIYQPNSLANWRDIRSGIFVGSSSSLSLTTQLAANSSGNGRWDLVYATLALDANGPSQSRRVKSPSTAVVSVQSVPAWLASPVTVTVLTGTPGSSPVIPTVPADSAGNYNAPLAAIYVANGFTTGTTILSENIRSLANATSNYMLAPGHGAVEPASGNNDRSSTIYANFPWAPRPGPFMPPDMVGGKQVLIQIDAMNANPALWSHVDGAIVDDSIDWRNRFVLAFWCVDTVATLSDSSFGTDPAGAVSGDFRLPVPQAQSSSNTDNTGFQMASTFSTANDTLVTGNPTVLQLIGSGVASGWPTGGSIQAGLFCEAATGKLKFFGNNAGKMGRIFVWLMASAAMPNY